MPSLNLPDNSRPLILFQICNACNFTIAMGVPLVLTARHLGASEAFIGFLTSLAPFMAVLQLASAPFVERYGCRQFMLWGWGLRTVMLLAVIPLPLVAHRLGETSILLTLAVAMILYTGIRGFASSAWLPWLNQLIPSKRLGSFLGVEQTFINISASLTLLGAGWFLGQDPAPWRYSAVFLIACVVGFASVAFLAKAPAMPPPSSAPAARPSEMLHKARRIFAHHPFHTASLYILTFNFAMTALPVFLVLYIKEEVGWGEGTAVKLQALSTVGILVSAASWGRLIDYAGRRPVLRIADMGLIVIASFWLLLAMGVLEPIMPVVALAYFAWGIFFAMHFLAQIKLIMSSCPDGELTMGAALMGGVGALSGGTAPLIWGLVLEALREPNPGANGATSFAFAVLFAASIALAVLCQWMLGRIRESEAIPAASLLVQGFYGFPMRLLGGVLIPGARSRRRKRR